MNIQELIKELRFKGDSEIHQAIHQAVVTLTIEGKLEAYQKGHGEGIKMAANIVENWAKEEKLI